MRTTRIRTTARRLDIEIKPERPVVVLHGPNGVGKSTALNSMVFGPSGTLMMGGKQVAADHLVYRAMMDGAGSFRTRLEFEADGPGQAGFVDRTLIGADDGDGGLKVTGKVGSTFAPNLTGKAATGAILAAVGNPAIFDAQAFLALGPAERQDRMLKLCAALARAWTPQEVAEAVERHAQALVGDDATAVHNVVMLAWGDDEKPKAFEVSEDETFYAALSRYQSAADKRVRATREAIERIQKAIERLDQDAAQRTQAVQGTVEHWDEQIVRLGHEIENLQRDLGRAEQTASRRKSIDGELERLRALSARPVGEFDADVEAARTVLASLRRQLASVEAQEEPVFQPSPDLPQAIAERERAHAALAALNTQRALVQHDIAALDATLKTLEADHEHEGATADCPTCRQPIRAEHVEALRRLREHAQGRLAETAPEQSRLEAELRFATVDLNEIEQEDQARRLQIAREAEALASRRAHLRTETAAGGPAERAVTAAETALAERQAVEERLEALENERGELGTEDPTVLRAQLQGAETQRADARKSRSQVAEADERRRTRLRAVADRREAEEALPVAVKAAEVWAAIVHEFGLQAVAPFVEMLNRMAPAGTVFDVEIAKASVRVALPGRPPIPFVSLSDGEASGLFPALSLALARTSGARWRCVLADRAEAMQSAPAPGAPHGMLVRFVEGMVNAAASGEIDQAFIATARLTPDELRAIEAAGAQVVHMGQSEQRSAERPAVQAAVDVLTAAGVKALYEWLGVPYEDNLPLARAMAPEHAAKAGKSPADVIAFCKTQPSRARTTTHEGAPSEEASTP